MSNTKKKSPATINGLPPLFQSFDVYLASRPTDGSSAPTRTLKGTVKGISINHAATVLAKKKFGTIRSSKVREVWYEAEPAKQSS